MTAFDPRNGRFSIERHMRRPHRGPADMVADGWDLTDSITGSVRRVGTIADANQHTNRILTDEQAVVALDVRRAWITTPTGPAPYGIREAWGTTPTGQRFMLGVFATTDIEQRINALCDHLNIRP